MYIRLKGSFPETVQCWKGFKTVLNPGAWDRLPDYEESDYLRGDGTLDTQRANKRKELYDAQWEMFENSKHIEGPFLTQKEVDDYMESLKPKADKSFGRKIKETIIRPKTSSKRKRVKKDKVI